MRLRSKTDTCAERGDGLDETEYVPSSDSAEKSSSDKAKDFLSLLENNLEDPKIHEENDAECSRRSTKAGSRRKRGRSKKEDVDWVEGMSDEGDTEIELLDGVDVIDFFGLEKKRGKKHKKKKRKKKKSDKRYPPLLWEVWEAEHNKWLNEDMDDNIDLDNQNEILNKTASIPCDLTMPLLRYQNEWLAWALEQEESEIKGGILADEMGMGKTIQAIALVLAKREAGRKKGELDLPILLPSLSTELPKVKCTLVVCPLVAVCQWVNEIFRFTIEGSTRVLVYHGVNRKKDIQQFSDYDFIITTYSIVESEYRRNVMPPKQMCKFCGNMFHTNKLRIHLKYFCGPDAAKTEKQSKQTKKKYLKSAVRLTKHIPKSGKDEAIIPGDVIEAVPKKDGKGQSIFHSVKWDRIILDEAHYIKDRQNNTAKAIHSMESCYKWALSGTPLQNRVGELYSLVRFLRITPYSYYFCKDCDCKRLDFCSSQVCSFCPHKSVRHFCWWNRNVATPIQNYVNGHSGQRAMHLLKHKILKSILLRRTKKGRAADLALPPRIISLRRDVLDIKEDDYYKSLYSESLAQFDTYVESGTLMNNYAHIFDLLTRLRQAVDHPYLVVYSRTIVSNNENTYNNATVCGSCHEQVEDLVITACGHSFCKACLIGLPSDLGNVLCPSCSEPITADMTTNINGYHNTKSTIKGFKRSSILNRIRLEDFQTSTKIEALREEIRFMVEKDGSAKGIVFSQFTSFLDLINYSLQKCGVMCVQLVGSMTMGARDAAIAKFTNDPNCRIFLMSLKAGGVALNLTAASHVFLMDPWWNPAVEQQAQDRIHRIGQYKPIRIVRFVIENTIEERILKLQEKKDLVFEGTVGGSSEALGKLTEADMRFLFMT